MPNIGFDCTLLEAHLLNIKRGNQAVPNYVCHCGAMKESYKLGRKWKEAKHVVISQKLSGTSLRAVGSPMNDDKCM